MEGTTALLVGGSQGFPGTSALTRQASKTIGEISPAATLVLALQALAKHLDADAILGITADEQTPCARTRSSRNRGTTHSGDEQRGAPGSVLPAPHLSNGHRARARRKRELKERILAQLRENAERLFSVVNRLPLVLLAAFSIA